MEGCAFGGTGVLMADEIRRGVRVRCVEFRAEIDLYPGARGFVESVQADFFTVSWWQKPPLGAAPESVFMANHPLPLPHYLEVVS